MKFLPIERIQNQNNFIINVDIFVDGKIQLGGIFEKYVCISKTRMEKKPLVITKDSNIDLNRFIYYMPQEFNYNVPTNCFMS